jgi:hypothetical protein
MEQQPVKFNLQPDWFLQRPIDFEHKEYVLNSFLVKVEDALSRGEIYPYFTEISLHMASVGSFLKHHKYIFVKKDLLSIDDEIMLYELKSKKTRRQFTQTELNELEEILKSAQEKLMQYFTICKGIWDISYQSTSIKLRKNKNNLKLNDSYMVYQDLFNKTIYVWECTIERNPKVKHDTRLKVELIYKGDDKKFTEVIGGFSKNKSLDLPIFEAFSTQNFPIESTLLPLFKRKVQSYFTQSLP